MILIGSSAVRIVGQAQSKRTRHECSARKKPRTPTHARLPQFARATRNACCLPAPSAINFHQDGKIAGAGFLLGALEILSVALFTFDYVSRALSASVDSGGLMRYVLSFYGLVDLFSVLPFFLGLPACAGLGSLSSKLLPTVVSARGDCALLLFESSSTRELHTYSRSYLVCRSYRSAPPCSGAKLVGIRPRYVLLVRCGTKRVNFNPFFTTAKMILHQFQAICPEKCEYGSERVKPSTSASSTFRGLIIWT